MRRAPAAVLSLLLLGLPRPAAATPPPGFTDSLVTTIGGPTDLAFTPDGRMLITTQGGALRVSTGGALLATPALTISAICTQSERGLLGVTADPAFAANHRIYLFYTFLRPGDSVCVNRVSRFTLPDSNVIDPASETVLLDNMSSQAGNHNAGDVHFGPDGYLYVSIGDGGCDYLSPANCGGANDASRDENILLGKILRITADGGIPPTNPFQGAGTARCNTTGRTTPGLRCQETFAWGLRNPFRFAFDPNAAGTRFFINDVGQSAWEEIDLGQAGADYGWNCREGRHTNNTSGPCSPTPAGMVEPIFEYSHSGNVPGTSVGPCGSITGGAFVPNGLWPGFDGAYLFSDFNCGAIFSVGDSGASGNAAGFDTGLGGGSAVAMTFGPAGSTQALYYTTYAGGGQVRQILYTNQPPVPSILTPAAAATFRVGQSVTLTGSATDPQDGTLPASSLSWTVLLHHGAQTDPFFGPMSGNNLQFMAPAPLDLASADTSFLEIRLTATDSLGLPATVTQNFQPHKIALTFATVPTGLTVTVAGTPQTAPQTLTSWENWGLGLDAPTQTGPGGATYIFGAWSDGGGAMHTFMTPAADATVTATFQASRNDGPVDYFTVTPCRAVDTRFADGPALAAGASRTFVLTGLCGVPSTAKAVAIDVTVIPSGSGYLNMHRGDELPGSTSTINFQTGIVRSTNSVMPLGAAGDVSVLSGAMGSVHLVIDVVGYFN